MPPKAAPEPSAKTRKKADRLEAILLRLDALFPRAECALKHADAWQLLVATILSAQCTDERVNKVTPGLFQKYPTIKDFAAAAQVELAQDIRSTGFFNNKSKAIIGAARRIVADFDGRVPETLDELLTLPGVARKTANVVLGTAFGLAVGVVVDTHVYRIARRLDLSRANDAEKIERDLMSLLPPERWISFAHQLILHGRGLCTARKPRCAECPLDELCYAEDKTT